MAADKENLLGNLEFLLLVIIPFIPLTVGFRGKLLGDFGY